MHSRISHADVVLRHVLFTLKCLLHDKSFADAVELSRRFNHVSHNRHVEVVNSVSIHAQTLIWSKSKAHRESLDEELAAFDETRPPTPKIARKELRKAKQGLIKFEKKRSPEQIAFYAARDEKVSQILHEIMACNAHVRTQRVHTREYDGVHICTRNVGMLYTRYENCMITHQRM